MKHIKILHFIPSLRSGGMERQLVELIRGFKRNKAFSHEIVLMSSKIHYKNVFNFKVPITVLDRKTKYDIKLFVRLFDHCLKIRPDIIHSWNSMCSIYALPVAKLLGNKFINGFIRDAPPNISYLNKNKIRALLTFPFSDAIISNSIAGLKAYKVPNKKAQFIYNGFDFGRLSNIQEPESVRASLGITQNQKIIGMVASFFDNKDHATFIQSCQKIMKNRSNIIAILVGNGPNMKDCKRAVAPEFRHKFLFLGECLDVENIVNVFDIGVLTSNTKIHGEGISNSVMEYMALSKPVVVTKGGGNSELVRDGKTGFLVDNGAITDLANKLLLLIDNPGLAALYGAAGYKCIKNYFSLSKMIDGYSMLYRKLAKANI